MELPTNNKVGVVEGTFSLEFLGPVVIPKGPKIPGAVFFFLGGISNAVFFSGAHVMKIDLVDLVIAKIPHLKYPEKSPTDPISAESVKVTFKLTDGWKFFLTVTGLVF